MHKLITTCLLCIILTQSFGQTQRKVSTYLFAQYNKTMYDVTEGNNPWGMGLGLQTYVNTKTKFRPTLELTGDIYLEDDKIYRTDPDGKEIPVVEGMVNVFFGSSYHPAKQVYLSFVAGPSFINGQTLFGIKPSFGFYFSKSQRCTGKISYINIFNRDKTTKEDFGSISIAVGLKLF